MNAGAKSCLMVLNSNSSGFIREYDGMDFTREYDGTDFIRRHDGTDFTRGYDGTGLKKKVNIMVVDISLLAASNML
ncbi:hypothetical protein ACH3XW_28165 [Acanthocheilonema viteae]